MIANTMSLLLGILSTFLRKSSKLKGDFRPKENFEQKLIYIYQYENKTSRVFVNNVV